MDVRGQQPGCCNIFEAMKSGVDERGILENLSSYDLDSPNKKGFTPLMFAIKKGYINIAAWLIDNNSYINLQSDKVGRNALYMACRENNITIANKLISNGAYLDIDEYYIHSLFRNFEKENHEVLNILKTPGINRRKPENSVAPKDENVSSSTTNSSEMEAARMKKVAQTLQNPLNKAIRAHNLEFVKNFPKEKLNGELDALGSTLIVALNSRDDEISEYLIPHVDVNKKDYRGVAPLGLESNSSHITRLLVNHGADIFNVNSRKSSLLMAASDNISHGMEIVEFFFTLTSNTDYQNAKGDTALICAASAGNSEIVNYLIDKGSDVNLINLEGNNALMEALSLRIIRKYVSKEVMLNLIENTSDLNHLNNYGKTAYMLAEESRNEEFMLLINEAIEKRNANPLENVDITPNELSPMLQAFYSDDIETVKDLLSKGQEIDFQDSEGNTFLMLATQVGNNDMIELFLEKGANANLVNKRGNTALMEAVNAYNLGLRCSDAIFDTLVEKTSNLDQVNKKGDTVLLMAAEAGNNKIIRALIESNLDVNANFIDKGHKTALIKCITAKNEEGASLLINVTTNINCQIAGVSALVAAADRQLPELVKKLVAAGAVATFEDENILTFGILAKYRNLFPSDFYKGSFYRPEVRAFDKESLRLKGLSHSVDLKGIFESRNAFGIKAKINAEASLSNIWFQKKFKVNKYLDNYPKLLPQAHRELLTLVFENTARFNLRTNDELMKDWESGLPLIIPFDTMNHATHILFWDSALFLCDGGRHDQLKLVKMYKFDKSQLSTELFDELRIRNRTVEEFNFYCDVTLPTKLNATTNDFTRAMERSCPIAHQTVGNCAYFSGLGPDWAIGQMITVLDYGKNNFEMPDTVPHDFRTKSELGNERYNNLKYLNQLYHLERYANVRVLRAAKAETNPVYQPIPSLLEAGMAKMDANYRLNLALRRTFVEVKQAIANKYST